MLEARQLNNIVALNTGKQVIGFHAHNLEVAQLSEEAWSALSPTQVNSILQNSSPEISEAYEDLVGWEQEISSNSKQTSNQFAIKALTLNVNQICNLHCDYCAAGGNGTYGDPVKNISIEKTMPQLRWMMDRLPEGESFSINFLGGEPLLYPDAIEMIADYASELAQLKKLKIKLGITTNGTLISKKIATLFANYKFNITISLDGPPEINDKVRPTRNGESSTALIEQGLLQLMEVKDQLGYLRFGGVFGKHNLNLVEAYNYYSRFDVDIFSFNYDALEKDPQVSRSFTEQMLKVAELAVKKGGETELRKIEFFDRIFDRLDSQTRLSNYCGAGKSYMVLDAKNQLFTCPWDVNSPQERVGINNQLDQERLQGYLPSQNSKNDCRSCWARNLCGGGCSFMHKNKTGSKDQTDTEFCLRTRSLIGQALVYYLNLRLNLAG